MQQALNACRIAARCVFFRQLLSRAAQAELTAQLPQTAGYLAGNVVYRARVNPNHLFLAYSAEKRTDVTMNWLELSQVLLRWLYMLIIVPPGCLMRVAPHCPTVTTNATSNPFVQLYARRPTRT